MDRVSRMVSASPIRSRLSRPTVACQGRCQEFVRESARKLPGTSRDEMVFVPYMLGVFSLVNGTGVQEMSTVSLPTAWDYGSEGWGFESLRARS